MQHRNISTDSITNTAITITRQSGLAALTMPKIANELGIKSQSLYNHVSNLAEIKTNMSLILFKELKTRLLEGMLGLSGKTAIRAYFKIWYVFCSENQNLNEVLFLPGREHSEKLTQTFHDVILILETLLTGIIADQAQVRLYTRTLMSMFVGFILNDTNQFFEKGDKQGQAAFDDMLDLILATLH